MELFICQYCNSERKNHNSWRNHERCCSSNPNRKYKNGMTGKVGSNQFKKAKLLGLPIPPGTWTGKVGTFTGKKHTDETKLNISRKLSINNKGGRSKWYEVSGQMVQGTWERNVAEQLTTLGITWQKLKVHNHTIPYELNGKIKHYTPDFYLSEHNLYLEIKGYWWGDDKNKMIAVQEQHPNIKIIIIEKQQYEEFLGGKLIW